MSLFLRRQVQRCVNDLVRAQPRHIVQRLVQKMNERSSQALAFEWECVLLWALSQHCRVEYERGEKTGAKVDLTIVNASGNPAVGMDVRTVSDHGRHTKNDMEPIFNLLRAALTETGVRARLSFNLGGKAEGEYGAAIMKLRLPSPPELDEIQSRVVSFLREWNGQNGAVLNLFEFADGFVVEVGPGDGLGAGYPSYTTTYSLDRNPVAQSLQEKHRQMARLTDRPPLMGVVLADGGCYLLRDRVAPSIDLKSVVTGFLESRENILIDFVLCVPVYTHLSVRMANRHYIEPSLFCKSTRVDVLKPFLPTLNAWLRTLPQPRHSGENAFNLYGAGRGEQPARSHPMSYDGQRISVSTKWLLDILAGVKTVEEAMAEYSAAGENPFKRMLKQSRLPTQATVKQDSEMDGDAIEFVFGIPDAAAGPFRMPDDPAK